jgi:hypothetical protein
VPKNVATNWQWFLNKKRCLKETSRESKRQKEQKRSRQIFVKILYIGSKFEILLFWLGKCIIRRLFSRLAVTSFASQIIFPEQLVSNWDDFFAALFVTYANFFNKSVCSRKFFW